MNVPLIILGAGGHARVIIDALLPSGRAIVGIVDNNPALEGRLIMGVPIIGDDQVVLRQSPQQVELVNGLGAIRSMQPRQSLWDKFKNLGYHFANVTHPAATVALDTQAAEGVQIMAGAVIQIGSHIGVNSIINTKASVDHDCRIGNHVHIAPGATLSGGVCIGDNVHIGTGAVIIQGIRIGHNSVIAAGAVVINNVPDDALVMGVPGKVVRYEGLA